MDPRQDPDAWADALLDAHRTARRVDPELEREATVRALQEMPVVERWMLVLGGRERDPYVVQRVARASRFRGRMLAWDVVLSFISLLALCAFSLVVLSFL